MVKKDDVVSIYVRFMYKRGLQVSCGPCRIYQQIRSFIFDEPQMSRHNLIFAYNLLYNNGQAACNKKYVTQSELIVQFRNIHSPFCHFMEFLKGKFCQRKQNGGRSPRVSPIAEI